MLKGGGEQNLTLVTIEKIANALQVDIVTLFGYEDLSGEKQKLIHIVEFWGDKSDEDLDRVIIILKQVFK